MSVDEKFDKAAADVKNLNATPKDDELLEVYALFKQATVGDNTTDKPGMFDFKGKAKWEAWNGKKGVGQAEAKEQYVATVDKLIQAYGLKA